MLQYDEAEARRERAKHSLERYMHYYERWASNQTVCSRYLSLVSMSFSVSMITTHAACVILLLMSYLYVFLPFSPTWTSIALSTNAACIILMVMSYLYVF